LALIQGYPGTGKSRTIAEVLRQAVRGGQRVLFLACSPAGIDRVLERLASEGLPGILRCLGPGETEVSLPASVVPLTLAYRLRHFEQQTLPAACRAVQQALAQVESQEQEQSQWAHVEACVQRQSELGESLRRLKEQRADLLDVIEAEFDAAETSISPEWEETRRACRDAITEADARLKVIREESERLTVQQLQWEDDVGKLAPLAEIRQSGRWWSVAWWRTLFQGARLARLSKIQAERRQANDRLEVLQEEEKEWISRRCQSEANRAQKKQEAADREHARRDRELAGRQSVLERESEEMERRWQLLRAQFDAKSAPSEATVAAVQGARREWSAQHEAATREVVLRRRWLEVLQRVQSTLPSQLADSARVVAATVAGLPVDANFSDYSAGPRFDLLVIDEAHRVGEAELIALAGRARRWILVGDVAADLPSPSPLPRRNGPPRPQPVQARPAFQRLWCQLHTDPRRLPSHWRVAGGRLIGTLHPIAAEQTPWVQHEAVFDRPEIELRIVSPPRQEAVLAEVLFPVSTPVDHAKEFIYRELQALSVEAGGAAIRWSEDDLAVTLYLDSRCDCSVTAVSLEAGIRELVTTCGRHGNGHLARASDSPWRTCALEFDRGVGWDRPRAERWVGDRLALRDSGRTAVLCRPYRAREPLAHFLSEVLYGGSWRVPCTAFRGNSSVKSSSVEFIPVPPATTEPRRVGAIPVGIGGGGSATAMMAPRTRTAKGGAGLEIDLAAPRKVSSMAGLPDDLRAGLPSQGIVNYAEARAIVEALECMSRESSVVTEASERLAGPTVAVISLFPSQVELLRRMIQRSTLLAGSPLRIDVGLPGTFHQRETEVALVSLTRSHASRAVPFSDTPQSLLAALTRCALRLVLFGDPGTMLRRSQWHGGLDHLDEIVGPVEQALVGQLLSQLSRISVPAPEDRSSRDAPARVSRSRESSGV
jgi:hypothetical protein